MDKRGFRRWETTTQGLVRSAVEGSMEADGPVYGLVISGQGLVPYVDPTFRIGADEVAIVIEPYNGTPRMKITTSENFRGCGRQWPRRYHRCPTRGDVQC